MPDQLIIDIYGPNGIIERIEKLESTQTIIALKFNEITWIEIIGALRTKRKNESMASIIEEALVEVQDGIETARIEQQRQ